MPSREDGAEEYAVAFGGSAGGIVKNAPSGSGSKLFKITKLTSHGSVLDGRARGPR
jgi:hypothetical protein